MSRKNIVYTALDTILSFRHPLGVMEHIPADKRGLLYYNLFIHSSVDGLFLVLSYHKENCYKHLCGHLLIFSYTPKSIVAGSQVKCCMFSLRNCSTVFQRVGTILHSNKCIADIYFDQVFKF